MPETIAHAEPPMAAPDEPRERECLLCYEEAEKGPAAPCIGIGSHDPLDLCARWSGWYLTPPGDPYGDDDEDDFELRGGF